MGAVRASARLETSLWLRRSAERRGCPGARGTAWTLYLELQSKDTFRRRREGSGGSEVNLSYGTLDIPYGEFTSSMRVSSLPRRSRGSVCEGTGCRLLSGTRLVRILRWEGAYTGGRLAYGSSSKRTWEIGRPEYIIA